MKIFFLGTNGWFATRTGNTVCAAILADGGIAGALRPRNSRANGGRLIVLDAGDGFQHVPALMARLGVSSADVFLSHLHIDHIGGLHTLPLLPRGARVRVFAHKSYLPALKRFVAHPYTATPSEQWAKVTLHPLSTGENKVHSAASGPGARARRQAYLVQVLPLDHADPCFGFRFSLGGKEIAYCTDTGPCKNISILARNADALITECALLPGAGELKGWPHLSPEMAAREAKKAGAKRLILTHFDARKYPALRLRAAAQKAARKIFPRTVAARDGMELEIKSQPARSRTE
ncbi:MAG: MBL fold metallo-hydrolase [Candidatus Micrarchaeia archaeon]